MMKISEIKTTTVRIETENGAKIMRKPVGTYITMEAPNMAVPDDGLSSGDFAADWQSFWKNFFRKPERKMSIQMGMRYSVLISRAWEPSW